MLEQIDKLNDDSEVNTTRVFTVNVDAVENSNTNNNADEDTQVHIEKEIAYANRLLAEASKHPLTTATFLLTLVGLFTVAPASVVNALEVVIGLVMVVLTVAGMSFLQDDEDDEKACDCSHKHE